VPVVACWSSWLLLLAVLVLPEPLTLVALQFPAAALLLVPTTEAGDLADKESDTGSQGDVYQQIDPGGVHSSVTPEVIETPSGQPGISHRVLDVAVPKLLAQRPASVPLGRQIEAAGMPQQVGVGWEWKARQLPSTRHHLPLVTGSHRPLALGLEYEWAVRVVTLQPRRV